MMKNNNAYNLPYLLFVEHNNNNYGINRRDYYRGSQDCLLAGTEVANTAGTSASSIYSGTQFTLNLLFIFIFFLNLLS